MKRKVPAILTSLFVLSVLSSFQMFGWLPLQYWNIAGSIPFTDLASVLGSVDCYRQIGFQIYEYPIGHGCAYNYGSFLMRFISFFGLGKNETLEIGFVFIFFFAILVGFAVYFLKISEYKSLIFLGFVVFSPPILLLFERGNLDILIYALILIAALASGRRWINISLIIIFITTLFKFYSLVLYLFLTTMQKANRAIPFFVIAITGMFQILEDYERGPGFINIVWVSFGGPVAGLYLGYLGIDLPYIWSILFGLFLLLIAVFSIYSLSRSASLFADLHIEKLFPNSYLREIYVFNLVTHVTCYVLGMSFDYRLVFLATSCVLLIFNDQVSKNYQRILAVALLVTLWTSANILFLQPLGDIIIGILTAFFTIQVFQFWFQKQNKTFIGHSKRFVKFLLRSQK